VLALLEGGRGGGGGSPPGWLPLACMRELVASRGLDMDRVDYIVRDSLALGMPLPGASVEDVLALVRSARCVGGSLAFSGALRGTVAALLARRRHLASHVYSSARGVEMDSAVLSAMEESSPLAPLLGGEEEAFSAAGDASVWGALLEGSPLGAKLDSIAALYRTAQDEPGQGKGEHAHVPLWGEEGGSALFFASH
jgi:HD superfamily phosphohydrolase